MYGPAAICLPQSMHLVEYSQILARENLRQFCVHEILFPMLIPFLFVDTLPRLYTASIYDQTWQNLRVCVSELGPRQGPVQRVTPTLWVRISCGYR